jgi:hypothetical protein
LLRNFVGIGGLALFAREPKIMGKVLTGRIAAAPAAQREAQRGAASILGSPEIADSAL